jgi:hypothetical protein
MIGVTTLNYQERPGDISSGDISSGSCPLSHLISRHSELTDLYSSQRRLNCMHRTVS